MADRPERLDPSAFGAQYHLPGWTVANEHLVNEFSAGSYRAAAALVGAIADLAERLQHHPDIDLRFPDRVIVSMTTHDVGGLSAADASLAAGISALVDGIDRST